jgi:hypothetical protein
MRENNVPNKHKSPSQYAITIYRSLRCQREGASERVSKRVTTGTSELCEDADTMYSVTRMRSTNYVYSPVRGCRQKVLRVVSTGVKVILDAHLSYIRKEHELKERQL